MTSAPRARASPRAMNNALRIRKSCSTGQVSRPSTRVLLGRKTSAIRQRRAQLRVGREAALCEASPALRQASRWLDGVAGARCNRCVAAPGPFAHLTISELKACAQLLYSVERADRDDAFYEDVEA